MREEARPPVDLLENRLEFETLITDASAALLAGPPDGVEAAVERTLERVRRFFGADRSALLRVHADPRVVNVRLASYGEGVPQVSPEVNLGELFPWARHRLLVEREPVRLPRTAETPPGADVDRASWQRLGVRSSLVLPIEVGSEVRHLIVIETLQRERGWPDALVTRLRVLGGLLVGALDRRDMFAGLREAEARVSLAADSAEAGLWSLDCESGVFWVTERARVIFGYGPEDVVTRERFEASVHPDDLHLVRAGIDRLLGAPDPVVLEYRIVRGDGAVRWISSRGRRQLAPAGEPPRLVGVSIDVTDRRRADEELADLGGRLLRAHEEERTLLARELHDDVTQRLAVLAIDVGRAELAATGAQAQALRAVREELARLSEDVHSLAYQLHPSVLEELGLAEALRTACERLERRTPVALTLELDPAPVELQRDAALCLFRVAQEALTNVARHAGARTAHVALRRLDAGYLLAVRDDGVGFDAAAPRPRRGLGLASMRERVRLLNGTLDVESAPGRGTSLVAWVPAAGGA